MRNPVARHLRTFNRASVERDRTKYHRTSMRTIDWLDEFEPPSSVYIKEYPLQYKFLKFH